MFVPLLPGLGGGPGAGGLPDVVGRLSQRAIGRDGPADVSYALNLVPMSRKSCCFSGISQGFSRGGV